METGKALEIVHGMAKQLHALCQKALIPPGPAEAQEALDTVEDLIVNNFADDSDCPKCGGSQ